MCLYFTPVQKIWLTQENSCTTNFFICILTKLATTVTNSVVFSPPWQVVADDQWTVLDISSSGQQGVVMSARLWESHSAGISGQKQLSQRWVKTSFSSGMSEELFGLQPSQQRVKDKTWSFHNEDGVVLYGSAHPGAQFSIQHRHGSRAFFLAFFFLYIIPL